MCIQKRFVKNRYTQKTIFVDCGKCVACQQKKRNYQLMLLLNNNSGYVFFVTLTYNEQNVPYVCLDELCDGELFIYRNNKIISSVSFNYDPYEKSYFDDDYHFVHNSINHVGVIYKKDIQNFFKRFRKYVLGHGMYMPEYFYASEYGGDNARPHLHLLLAVKENEIEFYKHAIIACWQMCSWQFLSLEKSFKYIPSKEASAYVASYLNKFGQLPLLLQNKNFMPKVHHSNFFGFNHTQFHFDVFFSFASKGVVTYPCQKSVTSSETSLRLYPKYVVNRYFPKIKGYSRLTYDDFINIYKYGLLVSDSQSDSGINYGRMLEYDYSDWRNANSIRFKCLELCKLFGVDYDYYLFVFWNFYKSYACYLIKQTHYDVDGNALPLSHIFTCYLNLNWYFRNNPLKSWLFSFNPNFTSENLNSHLKLELKYYKSLFHYQQKSIINGKY